MMNKNSSIDKRIAFYCGELIIVMMILQFFFIFRWIGWMMCGVIKDIIFELKELVFSLLLLLLF